MKIHELSGVSVKEISEINAKKAEIEKSKVNLEYEELQEKNREVSALKALDLGAFDEAYALEIASENKDYLLSARSSKSFLNDSFRGKVPFFSRNIILAVAETGGGKSTISANLTYSAILQGLKVLVITNEENQGDVYNRITCLIKGWHYANHEHFTDDQLNAFEANVPLLSKKLTVIGDSYRGIHNCTTSIEGIEAILNSVITMKSNFDLIIFDYYQNVDKSVNNPGLADWQVQYRFAKLLDQYKNKSRATLVVLAQKKGKNGTEISFKESIEGRKSILNVSTCALNIIKDVENYSTIFEIKKSRFNDCMGEQVVVGFDKGRYVPYNVEFKNKAQIAKQEKEQRILMAKVNPGGLGD